MAAAAPYIAMAVGAAVKNQAEKQQADQQRSQYNAALARTDATQKKSNTMVEGEADKLSPIARAAAMSMQTDQNAAGAKADLAASGATDAGGNAIIDTSGDHGAVSKEFLTAKADRALSEGARLTSIAQQLAKVRAPGQLVEQEGQDRANLSEQMGSMWDTTNHLNGANTATAQGIQLPAYAALGDVAQAAGSAYGSKGKAAVKGKAPTGSYVWGGDDTAGGFA